VTLERVLLESGAPFLIVSTNLNPDGCQNASFLALPTDPAMRDEYLSLALTALAANMKVEVYVDGCVAAPWGTVAQIYHINIRR